MNTTKKIIAIVFLYLATVGCEKMFIEEPSNNPEAIFENLWNTFNEEYAVFEERNIDWQAEYNIYRPMVNTNTTDDELFNILSQMLAKLDDGHVNLTAPNREIFYSNKIKNERIDDNLFSIPITKTYLEFGYKEGDENSYLYGKIKNENVAYIYFDYVGENFFKLEDFLNQYHNVNGYIIDLRHNQGGDFTYCFSEMGRLTDQPHYVFRSKTKNGKGPDDFTQWHHWTINPAGAYIDKPIIVLIDRYTISAGERAVMAFKTLPNVRLMGEITNGAHGTMIGRELANGWFYSLVTQKTEMFDGNSYEGIGLEPDIYSKNILSDVTAGIDKTLQTAIDSLK
ncbi:S41 family peptidase [Aequorivita sp. SDUM287046]|uniref:S41 family peptidase n=1 Tax=Aequorivita aurantiaca TaxID=3053356 RepID=A0ABT8DGZ8_9FLAO|nr:S41 family peptidase [Aequorivita aurantiaca]MDN3724122.1 S41 family peptidase [Aequorivita aurantiaca]